MHRGKQNDKTEHQQIKSHRCCTVVYSLIIAWRLQSGSGSSRYWWFLPVASPISLFLLLWEGHVRSTNVEMTFSDISPTNVSLILLLKGVKTKTEEKKSVKMKFHLFYGEFHQRWTQTTGQHRRTHPYDPSRCLVYSIFQTVLPRPTSRHTANSPVIHVWFSFPRYRQEKSSGRALNRTIKRAWRNKRTKKYRFLCGPKPVI